MDTSDRDGNEPRGTDPTIASGEEMIASAETVLPTDETLASVPASSGLPSHPDSLPVVQTQAYVRLDEFARGGLGRIVRARDQRTGRTVAIKEMLSSSVDAAARFVREALVTANLQHPAIVPVYEVGRWPDGQPFYAMKLVKGRPLSEVVADARELDDRLALVTHVINVADALAYAHGERVIHRDLKPQNVLCGAYGETVVIDWGLARRLEDTDTTASLPPVGNAAPGETVVGAVMGTPGYMAPEQARGERVDERADVYAIGALLYHVLTGKPPYTGRTVADLLELVRTASPRPVTDLAPGVPPDLAAIVERAISRERTERYPSAAELATDLRRFTTGQLVLAHHYTTGERVRRFILRYRAVIAIGTLALAALAIVGVISVRNVVAARGVAETQKQRADSKRDEAQHRLFAAYADRARVELAAGHPGRALPLAIAASQVGDSDPALRFITARALDAMPAIRRKLQPETAAMELVPGSNDILIGGNLGIERWSPERDHMVWQSPGITGDIVAIDATTIVAGRPVGVAVLDSATGKIIETLAPHTGGRPLGFLGIDPGRHWLAVPTRDGFIDLYELPSRKLVATIPAGAVIQRVPLVAADGERFVISTAIDALRNRLQIIDRKGAVIADLCSDCFRHVAYPGGVAFTAVQREGQSARIKLVDWSGRPLHEFVTTIVGDIEAMEVDHDHKLLALISQGGGVEVRDLATGTLRWRASIGDRGHEVKFDRSGRLWTISSFSGITGYDAMTGVELVHWHYGGFTLSITDDQRRMVAMHPQIGVLTWAIGELPVIPIAPTPGRVRRVVFADDGQMYSASEDGEISVFDKSGGSRRFARHTKRVASLQLLADGMLLSSSRDGSTRLWDTKTGAEVRRFEPTGPYAEASSDGRLLATGGDEGIVVLWDRTTGQKVRSFEAMAPLMRLRWSPDGKRLAAIDERGVTKIWETDGTIVRVIEDARIGIDVAFSPDSRWLIPIAHGAPVTLVALERGVADRRLSDSPMTSDPYTVDYTSDSARVLVAGSGFAGIWDVKTGALRVGITTTNEVLAAKFSPNGEIIYGGGLDRRLRAWNAKTGEELISIAAPSEVYGIEVARDGRMAATTLGPAFVARLAEYTGNIPSLLPLSRCRSELEVRDGVLGRATVDPAACNRTVP